MGKSSYHTTLPTWKINSYVRQITVLHHPWKIYWILWVQFQIWIKDRCLGSRSHHLHSSLWISSFRQVQLSFFLGMWEQLIVRRIMMRFVSKLKGNKLICSATGDQDELFDRIMAGTYDFISPFWDDVSSSAKVGPFPFCTGLNEGYPAHCWLRDTALSLDSSFTLHVLSGEALWVLSNNNFKGLSDSQKIYSVRRYITLLKSALIIVQ